MSCRELFGVLVQTRCFNKAASTGSLRMRLPVAVKIVLVTAGTIAEGPGFAHAARRLGARHDVDLDCRRFVDAQHRIAIEVGLFDAAVLQRDLPVERRRDAKDDRALDLRPVAAFSPPVVNDASAVGTRELALPIRLVVVCTIWPLPRFSISTMAL